MRNSWYNSRRAVISFHVIVWLLWLSLPVFFRRTEHEHGQKDNSTNFFNLVYIVSNICWILIFYFNAYFLIPYFLNKRKIWQYISILTILYFVVVVLMYFSFQLEKPSNFSLSHLPFFFIFIFLFIWAMSTVYRTVSDKAKTDQLLKDRENENLKTELSFLRSQVSPHFLFNVLNNM